MKSSRILLTLFGLFVLFVFVSCPGAPPAQEDVPPMEPGVTRPVTPPPTVDAATQPPDQESLNALNAAAARAEAARDLVRDFGGDEFFPSEWNNASSLLTQAEQQRRTNTTAETQESTARYLRAAEAFEGMLDRTIARFYEFMENELVRAREAAVNAGAQVFVPDLLLQADNKVASAEDRYRAGDLQSARNAAEDALNMYVAIRAGIQAYLVREEIEELTEQLAPEMLAEADSASLGAIDRWEAGDFLGARTGAENSLLLYLRAAATAERQRALTLRANMAAELEFTAAQDLYNRANMAFHMQWTLDAIDAFGRCRFMFRRAGDIALQRRLEAEAALRLADQRLAESDEIARNIEAIIQAGGVP